MEIKSFTDIEGKRVIVGDVVKVIGMDNLNITGKVAAMEKRGNFVWFILEGGSKYGWLSAKNAKKCTDNSEQLSIRI